MTTEPSKKEIFRQQMKRWWEENKRVWRTQRNLANHIGIGKSTIGDYISGKSFPSPEIAEKLFSITHIDILKQKPEDTSQIPFPVGSSQPQAPSGQPSGVKRQLIQRNVTPKLVEAASEPDTDTRKTDPTITDSRITEEADRQELFIPIFGFVWLYPEEILVLDHPVLQRLGRVNQLGLANLVYRGATHKRLEHSVGTVYVAQRMINAIRHTSEKAKRRNERYGVPIQPAEERFIRLGALLHDIGHIVSGHTIEDEMCLICKHDSDQRLNTLFVDIEGMWSNNEGLSLGKLIDREFQKYLPEDLAKKGLMPSDVVRLLIRKVPNEGKDSFSEKQRIAEESPDIRLNICRDIIGNTICADILDYLHRDWYHIGKVRTFDDRILQYMEIFPVKPPVSQQNPVPKSSDKFVICLGRSPKIRTDAVSQILELLEWRYQLTESVLFHRTKLTAEAMLARALYNLWAEDAGSAEKILLNVGDDQLFSKCREIAEKKMGKDSIAAKLLRALEERKIFTTLYTLSYYDLLRERRLKIQQHYSPGTQPSSIPAANRNQILQVLENDFNLTPGTLAMFCPGGSMKAKVADVVITVGDEANKFSKYEQQNEDSLSAGHLTAQIKRFERLWRVHFFIDRAEKKRIGPRIEQLLQDAILKLALGVLQPHEKDLSQTVARNIAERLTTIESSPWYGRTVRKEPVTAAYGAADAATGMYPFGAPSIRSYIENESAQSRS